MSVSHLLLAIVVGALAYVTTGALAKTWRKRGRRFTLKIEPEHSLVLDEDGNEVIRLGNLLSYRRVRGGLEVVAIGDSVVNLRQAVSVSLRQLSSLPTEEAIDLFAAFTIHCLARARRETAVPIWLYATIGLELDPELLPILDIARQAGTTRILRNAGRGVVVSRGEDENNPSEFTP